MKNKVKNISIISTGSWVPPDLSDKKIRGHTYKILVNNLILDASIGIHDFEKKENKKFQSH